MKMHAATELVSLLVDAIRRADSAVSFSVCTVDSPPNSCGLVSVTFDLDGLSVRMDRDRGEVDFHIRQPNGGWKILRRYWEQFASAGVSTPTLRTKELFDPGYSEDEAVREGASALVAMRASIARATE